jgi:hypothetical protein
MFRYIEYRSHHVSREATQEQVGPRHIRPVMFNIWKKGLSLLDQAQTQGNSPENGASGTLNLKRDLSSYRDGAESGSEPSRKRQRGASFKNETPINPEALKISEEAKARDSEHCGFHGSQSDLAFHPL